MAQSVFGAGFLFVSPGGAGFAANNIVPQRIARLQNVGVDFGYDLKTLHGSNQYAAENARGKAKIDIKAASGAVDAILFNSIIFGLGVSAPTTGEKLSTFDEQWTIPGSPFQVTAANGGGGAYDQDMGVYNYTTGKNMQRVASSPGVGAYSLNVGTGVYTFNTGNAAQLVSISYSYLSASTGKTLAYTNQQMGSNVVFGLDLFGSFVGVDGISRAVLLQFPAVQCPKLSMPMKLDDYLLSALDFMAQDDGAGNIFTYSIRG